MRKLSQKELNKIESSYYRETKDILYELFLIADQAYNWELSELAMRSGLSLSTIKRMNNGDFKYPRFQTIYKIALAVDCHFYIDKLSELNKAA